MVLKKLVIQGFRSVKDESTLRVDERVTILIGANDHGKSNLLEAIRHLNDDSPFIEEEKNWDLPQGREMKIFWHFDVDKDSLKRLGELKVKPALTITGKLADELSGSATESAVAIAGTAAMMIDPSVRLFPKNNQLEIVYSRDYATNKVKVESVPYNISIDSEAELLEWRPRVESFAPVQSNLVDEVNRVELDQPEYEFMQGIFRLAGIWDKRDEVFSQTSRTSMMLNEASIRLTKILNDKWNQGKDLSWKFEHTGNNGDHIVIQIQDPSISSRYTRPSLRSSGFKTYFWLSMVIYARTQDMDNPRIYLFDEPGTYLHPHAQLDLQKSFESIADTAQLLYTTHSLFLINKNYPDRNRVISKTKEGTKIDQKPFTKNWKSVRESLGILLSNNFLIAEKTLLVEGPSDVIYFLGSVRGLKEEKLIDMDLNDLSIVDAGTSENYVAMAKLMLSEGREVIALMDGDAGGSSIKTQLEKVCAKELEDKKLQIFKLPKNQSVEDVFTDIDVLRVAIRNVFNNLIAEEIRTATINFDIKTGILSIVPASNKTLGKVIDEMTKAWFDPPKELSKLSIALEYENLTKKAKGLVVMGKTEVEAIRDLLSIKGEKSKPDGVFEEIVD